MTHLELFIELLGWSASILILGAYALNSLGKISVKSPRYIWANLIGGIFFIINTFYHSAYPSAALNVIWVAIAAVSLLKKNT